MSPEPRAAAAGGATAAGADPLLGNVLGGARLERCLNKSKLSAVYLGRLENSGLEVAVKVFSPAWSRGGGMTPERFVREGRSLASLDHPNIVKVYDIGEQAGYFFIVMNFLKGARPLKLVGDQCRLTIPQVVEVARAIANALAYIHNMGLVHRDVKPTNIHITGDGKPILADFSLVKVEGASQQLTQQGTILGTVNYMPPEQARPDGSFGPVGPAADIYALGATMFWMMTGEPPFKGRTPMETIIKLLKEDVPKPSKFRADRSPPALEKLVLKMLKKKQSDRPQSAHDVMQGLEALIPKAPTPPPAPTPGSSAPPPVPRVSSGEIAARKPVGTSPSVPVATRPSPADPMPAAKSSGSARTVGEPPAVPSAQAMTPAAGMGAPVMAAPSYPPPPAPEVKIMGTIAGPGHIVVAKSAFMLLIVAALFGWAVAGALATYVVLGGGAAGGGG